jgi:hypothetical protein
MRTVIPVFLPIGVALTTDFPSLVKINRTIAHCMQLVTILGVVTRQTPNTAFPVLQ